MRHSTNSYGIAIPKTYLLQKNKKVQMAVNSVIINYNDGLLSINYVLDSLGFPAGR